MAQPVNTLPRDAGSRETETPDDRAAPRGGVVGDLLVALSACLLTVSIVGSGVYLGWRAYDKRVQQEKVDTFVTSLEHRSDSELAADVDRLRSKPKLTKYVLPRLLASVRGASDERQQVASVRVACAFLDVPKIRRALYDLRTSPRESVASAAVEALSRIQPPEEAAQWLGRCLDVNAGAVVDGVCAGLIDLGEPGRKEMRGQLGKLSVDRRIWLAGYIGANPVNDRAAWLDLLSGDSEPRVREAVEAARKAPIVARPTSRPTTSVIPSAGGDVSVNQPTAAEKTGESSSQGGR